MKIYTLLIIIWIEFIFQSISIYHIINLPWIGLTSIEGIYSKNVTTSGYCDSVLSCSELSCRLWSNASVYQLLLNPRQLEHQCQSHFDFSPPIIFFAVSNFLVIIASLTIGFKNMNNVKKMMGQIMAIGWFFIFWILCFAWEIYILKRTDSLYHEIRIFWISSTPGLLFICGLTSKLIFNILNLCNNEPSHISQ